LQTSSSNAPFCDPGVLGSGDVGFTGRGSRDRREQRQRVIAVPVNNPTNATAWANQARGGGIWAPGGISTDGYSIFVATGNTFGTKTWGGGEAVIRLSRGAKSSGDPADYFTPSNWLRLDDADSDIVSSGPIVIDLLGANPSQLLIALGKNGVA